MSYTPRILCLAGSLRRDSYNKRLVRIAMQGAKEAGAHVTYVDLKDLPMPLYDEDIETAEGLPENALKLKEMMKAHEGFLFSCPEYNSSISGVLKNAIDWASRPIPGERNLECFKGKVAGIMAASPGSLGGLRGLVTVRSILGNIGVTVIPDQIAIASAHEAFDENGSLKDEKRQRAAQSIGARVAEVTRRLFAPDCAVSR